MWHPDPDQLALAALPAERRDRHVDDHLTSCPLCRRHVDTLRCTVDLALAGGSGVLDDRPPDRIWQAITDELEIVPGPPARPTDRPTENGRPADRRGTVPRSERPPTERPPTERPPTDRPPTERPPTDLHPADGRRSGRRPSDPGSAPRGAARARRPLWRRLVLPVAAAVVGVAAGLGIGAVLTAPPAGTVVATLSPVPGPSGAGVDPSGTGTVEVVDRSGARQMLVRVDGVNGTAGGDYLEAWLMDPSGTRLVSLGALARDGAGFRGTFTVPADLPMDEFSSVDVSAERWDGDERHSQVSLMRGPLS